MTGSAGAPLSLDLTITNSDSDLVVIELPEQVHVRLETVNTLTTLEFTAERSGRIEVAPREFARIKLSGALPACRSGFSPTPTSRVGRTQESG